MTLFEDVKLFHLGMGTLPFSSRLLMPSEWNRRIRLILEELSETAAAHAASNLEEFADGLVDLAWVVLGTAVEAGLPFDELWAEVRRTNMAKLAGGGIFDSSGKLLKPDGWEGPHVAEVIAEAARKRATRCVSVFAGSRCLLDTTHPGDHIGTRKEPWA